MKIPWNYSLKQHPRHVLQEAGYHEFLDPNTEKISYIMRLAREFYPRYHVYITRQDDNGIELDIHIDQKHASYEGSRAHSGEYDGPLVEEEAKRLMRWLHYYSIPK